MDVWVGASQWLFSAALCVIAFLALREWRRHRGRVLRYQALAISLLAVVALSGRVGPLLRPVHPAVGAALSVLGLVVFVGCAWALVMLRNEFIPMRPWLLRTLTAVLAAMTLVSIPATATQAGGQATGWRLVVILLLIGAWVVSITDPVLRFWLAARGRTAVQRARLRSLSVAFGALVLVFILAIFLSFRARSAPAGTQLALQLLSLLIAIPMWAAFAPPAWLIRIWRAREDDAYRDAIQAMVFFSSSVEDLGHHAIQWAVRYVGGIGALLAYDNGELIAEAGREPNVLYLSQFVGTSAATRVVRGDDNTAIVVVPVHTGGIDATMVIAGDAATPAFGADTLQRLDSYATVVAVALERVHITTHLAAAEKAKSDFLNLASHEMRGPLTVLRGYLSMVADGDIDDTEVRPTCGRLLRQVDQMGRMVDEMLEVARLDEGRVELQYSNFDLNSVTSEVIEQNADIPGGQHRIELVDADSSLSIDADRERVRAILVNLVDNAVKYSPNGGTISCSVRIEKGMAAVDVSDEGVGVADKDMGRLFSRFGRIVTPDNAHISGTGLGLYLCRELARRHGGDLVAKRRSPRGMTFTLLLPLNHVVIAGERPKVGVAEA